MLIVLQGMDTAGKDGTITHVMSAFNPEGCIVTGLQGADARRAGPRLPLARPPRGAGRGTIGIFNRSHYEDVLVVRVHDLVPRAIWRKRYAEIDAFEQLLADSGTTIVKFFLHISPRGAAAPPAGAPQGSDQELEVPSGDLAERKLWSAYQAGLRGRAVTLLDQGRALVHHPGRPQMVPRPRRGRDRGPDAGRPQAALSPSLPRPGRPEDRLTIRPRGGPAARACWAHGGQGSACPGGDDRCRIRVRVGPGCRSVPGSGLTLAGQ